MADAKIRFIIQALKEGKGIEDIQKGLKDISQETKNTGKEVNQLQGFLKGLLPALGVAAIVGAFKSITNEAIKAEREERQLQQTITALGLENKITVETVKDLGGALQSLAGVGGGDVVLAFNALLKVTKDVKASQELVKLAVEMSSYSGKTLEETTQALTMAFMGNVKGLKEYGVSVKDGTTATEALEEVLKLASGASNEFGESTEGQFKKAAEAFDELKEASGRLFLPLLGWLAEITTKIFEVSEGAIKNLILSFQNLGIFGGAVLKTLKGDWGALAEANKKAEENIRKQHENTAALYAKKADQNKKLSIDLSKVKISNAKTTSQTEQNELNKVADVEKKLKEETKRNNEKAYKDDTAFRIKELNKQRDEYRKNKIDEKTIAEWYKSELDIINSDETRKRIELLKVQTGTHKEQLLLQLQELQASLPLHSAEWVVAGEAVKKVNEEINASHKLMIEDVVKRHTYDLLEGVRQGNFDINNAMQSLVDDIAKRWLTMIADMVAQWATSELTTGLTANIGTNVSGGGGGGGGGGNIVKDVVKGAVNLVTDPIGTIGGWIGDFFGFAQGGVVTKPTRAMIGETGQKEAILPLEDPQAMGAIRKALGGSGGGNITINVGAFMGKEQDAIEFAKMIKFYQDKINLREMTV